MFEPVGTRSGRAAWSVRALWEALTEALAARFAVCTVRGEVSGFSRAPSGHCYFNLKDEDGHAAVVRCAMFRRAAALASFQPVDGQRVEVRGRLTVFEPRGELQLVVESMQRAGDGALHEQFLRLKARLESEGLFDAARKRALPLFPRSVGLVTSLGGAVLHDMVTCLQRRAPHVAVVVYPSLVQGLDAPAALVEAIRVAGGRAEVDVLIVARGGGSIADLWAFNDERVVRAIAAAPLPVVCGVGHETDVTLADFAADVRAPTPTAAAELVAPTTSDCEATLAAFAELLRRRLHDRQDREAQRLDRIALHLTRPADGLRRRAARLELLGQRLGSTLVQELARRRHGLQALEGRWQRATTANLTGRHRRLADLALHVGALDPNRVLARGYAWLAGEGGHAVTSVAQMAVGDRLTAVLADGSAAVDVRGVQPGMAGGPPGDAAPPSCLQ